MAELFLKVSGARAVPARVQTGGGVRDDALLVAGVDRVVLGSLAVANRSYAGELIAECVLALNHGMKAGALSASIHTYPTLSQINRRAADMRLKESLTPNSKKWIRRLLGLRGA